MANILEIRHLEKSFGDHAVLRDINFSVEKGDVICIIGSSGSGKSTLLRCINFLEQPTGGEILYHGQNAETSIKRTLYNSKVGMVFQSFNLFGNLTVLDNCVLGQMQVLKTKRPEAEEKAVYYLEKVGMGAYRNARPAQLSGGQKQRVAIARALITQPKLILADEPTGALDSKTSVEVMQLLKDLNAQEHITQIIVTHDPTVASQTNRIVRIKDGVIE